MLHRVTFPGGVQAALFDRHGGNSRGVYQALNLGANTGDDLALVQANRAALRDELKLRGIAFANQVHANSVLEVNDVAARAFEQDDPPVAVADVDGLLTTVPNLGLGVLVADCVPVLLADATGTVVAIAHAGRRGLELGVLPAVVQAMRARGANAINAAIGPAICGNCYEVPDAMQREVVAKVPAAQSTTRSGTPGLDLVAGVRVQLAEQDVSVIGHVAYCTLEDDDFYSHRRASAADHQTGRFCGVIARAACR